MTVLSTNYRRILCFAAAIKNVGILAFRYLIAYWSAVLPFSSLISRLAPKLMKNIN